MKYLKLFQKKYDLLPDGIIGKNTLKKLAFVLDIHTKSELAHFLGQCHLESKKFKSGRENLNYSVKALKLFVKWGRMTELEAVSYGRSENKPANQVKIANTIYGNRWGKLNLGNTYPNDGWFFRGNGSIQLTGRYNHKLFANYIDDQAIMLNPDIILTDYYFESGIYFFDKNNVWKNCQSINVSNIIKVSKHVNLGNPNSNAIPNHLKEREQWTTHYYNLLKDITL